MPTEDGIEPGLVDELLALETREHQTEYLRKAGLFGAEGLDRILDVADGSLGSDPGRARRLAQLCVVAAGSAGAAVTVPRANYIVVQAYFADGRWDEALRLIEVVQDGYVALGLDLEALRTNVGKMAALLELGHYDEALGVGQAVLDALGGEGEPGISATPEERDMLNALVQQNRGGCLEYMGRYDEALAAYAMAEDGYRTLGNAERLGEVLDNRGAVLSLLGRGNEALDAHRAAAAIFGEAGLDLKYAVALHNMGEAYLRLANYTRSLATFEKVRRLYATHETLAYEHLLMLDMADNYLVLNLYTEATVAYREAEVLLQSAGMAHDRAKALWGMGSALVARGILEEAEPVLREAADLFDEAGNVPMRSGVMLEQASLSAARGDQAGALQTARLALLQVSGEEWPVQQVYARLRLADLLLPDPDAAESHLLAARRLTDRLALPQLGYQLKERLGRVRWLQGDRGEARRLLEGAVDEIERLRSTVAPNAMRTSFLRDKTTPYENLMRLYLADGGEGENLRAFAIAERAKSRALVDLIANIDGGAARNREAPEIEERIGVLQADLNAVYGELLGNYGEDHGRRVPMRDLYARARDLEVDISRLRLRAASAGSTPDPFANPASPEEVLRELPSDVTLLAYHVVDDEVFAFVGAAGNLRVERNLGSASEMERNLWKLSAQWDRFRAGRDFTGRHARLLERSTQQVLGRLYAGLFAPLEPLLGSSGAPAGAPGKLAIVAHGFLHEVPFHALFDGEAYLVERFEISYAPSATVYTLCQRREARGLERALIFGVEDPSIPEAAQEARAIAGRLPGAEVRVGEEATVAALRSASATRGILHLACHGLFRADNPMFSALKLHDGWLLATDAMRLDLTGALVVLSACESGLSEVIGGDETLGLVRAFLGAGAVTMVVSLWLVQDQTTAELMGLWYDRLSREYEPAVALRAAQLEIKERHPHPYFWAPFVLTGRR